MNEKARTDIHPAINTEADSVLGQIFGVTGRELASAWEVLHEVWLSGSKETASGFSLDLVVANTGTERTDPAKSVVQATLEIEAGKTIPAGSVAHVVGNPGSRFLTTAPVTNGSGVTAFFVQEMEAEEVGATVALAGTLTVIPTAVDGWVSVNNVEDATEGFLSEADSVLRTRQENERAALGCGSVDALRAQLLKIEGVLTAKVFENRTETVDANGVPGHHIEAVVFDGPSPTVSDDVIAQVIWGKGGGTGTFGTDSGNAVDVEGKTQVMNFSRPTVLDIYLEIDIVTGGGFLASSLAQIPIDLADYGDGALSIGDPVILLELACIVLETQGVTDVPEIRVGIAASPTQTTNYITAPREVADLDTGRIVINIV